MRALSNLQRSQFEFFFKYKNKKTRSKTYWRLIIFSITLPQSSNPGNYYKINSRNSPSQVLNIILKMNIKNYVEEKTDKHETYW